MSDEACVAVLGAGSTMGLGMARNIARAGMRVRGWNRTQEKALPLKEDGGEVLDSAGEAAEGADVVLEPILRRRGGRRRSGWETPAPGRV